MKLTRLFLSFGGLGFLPKMPGTWGSLGGIGLALFLPQSWMWIVICGIFMFSVLVIQWLVSQDKLQQEDPSWIVIDEVVGQMIPLALLGTSFCTVLIAFVSFRFFDILKPGPIGALESYLGAQKSTWGLGIMLDDVLAGFAAAALTYCCLNVI